MYDMALLLTFADGRVESAYRRHFSAAQLSLDVVFNAVLSAVTLSSTVKFWRECTPLERVCRLPEGLKFGAHLPYSCYRASFIIRDHGWQHWPQASVRRPCRQPLQKLPMHSVSSESSLQVLMPCMVAVSCAVPLAIWLRREAFLHHREPLLAFKVGDWQWQRLCTAPAVCWSSVAHWGLT